MKARHRGDDPEGRQKPKEREGKPTDHMLNILNKSL